MEGVSANELPTETQLIVIDNSVVMTWFFRDQACEYGERVRQCLPDITVCAPSVWPLEVANTLVVGERRRHCTLEQIEPFLQQLVRITIAIDMIPSSEVWTKVLSLARQHQLSAYDASYLELALRLGADLASLDQPLLSAARSAGVNRFEPNS